eukprot:TRINITY_DN21054_c0_g1_i1.p1 TRINITY_DN21054_c0_g1~~TRINITY_DN21054_c0_g1_i1.p1  ORF type:complete len:137 (+),score=14.99 TRINITY_DN21054_c0_g1_i1:166-576(+)
MSTVKVHGGKLVLKGGVTLGSFDEKKKTKKRKTSKTDVQGAGSEIGIRKEESEANIAQSDQRNASKESAGTKPGQKPSFEHDGGIGFAPDGKKSKKYEELFPVETKRFGYVAPVSVQTREEAVVERSKRKADRYCK